jgi:hypothetical protein
LIGEVGGFVSATDVAVFAVVGVVILAAGTVVVDFGIGLVVVAVSFVVETGLLALLAFAVVNGFGVVILDVEIPTIKSELVKFR